MKQRGEEAIDQKDRLETTVKVKFNLSVKRTKFSICHAIVQLLGQMKKVEPTMIAQSVKDGTLFTKPADILQTQQ
jgi:hypothetical protein